MRGIEYFIKNNTTGEIVTNTDYKTLNNFKKNAKESWIYTKIKEGFHLPFLFPISTF